MRCHNTGVTLYYMVVETIIKNFSIHAIQVRTYRRRTLIDARSGLPNTHIHTHTRLLLPVSIFLSNFLL